MMRFSHGARRISRAARGVSHVLDQPDVPLAGVTQTESSQGSQPIRKPGTSRSSDGFDARFCDHWWTLPIDDRRKMGDAGKSAWILVVFPARKLARGFVSPITGAHLVPTGKPAQTDSPRPAIPMRLAVANLCAY